LAERLSEKISFEITALCRRSCIPEVTMKTKKSISDDVRKAIALRAYHIWEREGRPHDRQAAHWQMAEAEILREQSADAAMAPHPAELVMAVTKPSKKKATTEPVAATKATEAAAVKTTKPKAAAAKAATGAKKSAHVVAKTVTTPAKTKKAVKAKAPPRQS
jgi:hypothetical protein